VIRTVVVEDEPIARQSLVQLLGELPDIAVVAAAADGESGLRTILAERPTLVLLDIQMPGLTGVAVAERIPFDVGVIFTTAFDDHAVKAFELGALDYLQKPFGRERLHKAITRARPALARLMEPSPDDATPAPATPELRERLALATAPEDGPLVRLFVRERGAVIPIRVSDLVRCEAEDDYVALYALGRRHLLYMRLSVLERRLDPAKFLRIHRSHLINVDCVAAIEPYDANRLAVRLTDGARLVASRAGTAALRTLMRA
jgi:two-component system, LytTR family, response regulator